MKNMKIIQYLIVLSILLNPLFIISAQAIDSAEGVQNIVSSIDKLNEKPIDFEPKNRQPIRMNMHVPGTHLAPLDMGTDDSVGIRLTDTKPENFRRAVQQVIDAKGKEFLRGGTFALTGLDMGKDKFYEEQYRKILDEEFGLKDYGIILRVMSIPKHKVVEGVVAVIKAIHERLMYFMFSVSKDYQKPVREVVKLGLITTAAVEVIPVWFLFYKLPVVDASATALSHIIMLTAMTIYGRSLSNWVLRAQTSDAERFLKSMLMVAPFVGASAVFGHLTPMVQYFQEYGWSATIAKYPWAYFSWPQFVVMVVQAWFVNWVTMRGIQGWAASQPGYDRNMEAQKVVPWLKVPFMAASTVFVLMTSAQLSMTKLDLNSWILQVTQFMGFENVHTHLQPVIINNGLVYLTGITLFFGTLFKYAPRTLDVSLPIYEHSTKFFGNFAGYLKNNYENLKIPKNIKVCRELLSAQ